MRDPLRSLRYRIVVSIVVIEIVMLSILVWSNTAGVRQTHADRLVQSADLILDQFTATVGRFLVESDFASLEEYAMSVLSHDELAYITITDAQGHDVLAIGDLPAARQFDESPVESSDHVYDVTAPIEFAGAERGRVDLGFTLQVMEQTIQDALRRGISIASVEVFLSVLVALALGFGLTRNLESLSSAVERFRRGERKVAAPVSSNDEIGDLAATFNAMVADRERSESALRLSEERLRQATELAGLGYWIWDLVTDKCLFCSKEYAEILAMTADDVSAQSCCPPDHLEAVHPDDRASVERAFAGLRTGAGFKLEYRVTNAQGDTRWIEEVAKPVADETGRMAQAYGTVHDITEIKLAEEQLRQAQKMEIVGQLTGGVAHDFNNLLAISMGNLELLREEVGQQPDAIGFADVALGALDRGRDLTHRLLAFSRRQPLLPEPIDPNELVSGMVDLLKRTLGETIEIGTILADDVCPIMADRSQLETALLNLAVNARDAMPDGGRLTLETDRWIPEGSVVGTSGAQEFALIAVHDTGCGMSSDVVSRAFDPFFTTKEVGKGSGLGLSMVFGFIKQSAGDVRIESNPGVGTTVRLFLPRADWQDSRAGASPVNQAAVRGEGESILVVEDDRDVRRLVVALLTEQGYAVSEAGDGASALQLLRSGARFDLLFADLVLPGGISGEHLASKARDLCPDLRVLYTTGYTDNLASLGHHSNILLKPFKKAALTRAVREALDRRPVPARRYG